MKKQMLFKTNGKILRIFSFLLLCAATPLAADLPVAPRVQLREDLSGRDRAFLGDAVRQLDRLRKLAGLKLPPGELKIAAGQPRFSARPGNLELPGNAASWERDFELRRRIYGALAAHRFRLSAPTPTVFPWVAAGLDEAVDSAGTMGQYVAGNSTYPLLASYYRITGKLPDFHTLCRLPLPQAAPVGDLAGEQARLLLEIMARNRRIGDLFTGMTEGREPDFWLVWYAGADAAQNALTTDAEPLLWNRYSPLPPELAEARTTELETFLFPEITAEGKHSGKVVSGNFRELAEQFSQPREDRTGVLDALAARWRRTGRLLTVEEREQCFRAAAAIQEAGVDPAAPDKFASATGELKRRFALRRTREEFLRATLDARAAPLLRLRRSLAAARTDNSAPGPSEAEFFARTLERYLR